MKTGGWSQVLLAVGGVLLCSYCQSDFDGRCQGVVTAFRFLDPNNGDFVGRSVRAGFVWHAGRPLEKLSNALNRKSSMTCV